MAPGANPPIEWSEKKNVRWKTELPGRGHSTPIVIGKRVFLTAAVPYGEALPPRPSAAPGNHDNLAVTHRQRFIALAVSRADGRIIWQRKLHQAMPQEQGHHTASLASNSPVSDGERLFAFFGSFGLYCLDFGGYLPIPQTDTLRRAARGCSERVAGRVRLSPAGCRAVEMTWL